ncbi:FAD:protein FMN transferase [Ketobacter sp.]|uniref:FAD:protein FMN transferase n=1 Tax=Ketobacter sp. TaxID=2083498 RepID=UPI000F2124AF|nr:FAD:protein FMN transferase [Ketobacter sp.]RLU01670.1 MAG: FAD:protein FMN transferase [Ketobacter sp.]
MKTVQPVIFSLVISLLLTGCSRSDAPEIMEFSGRTMGTWYTVKVAEFPATADPQVIAGVIEAELDNVNDKMSTYKPDSELSRFNRAPVGEPFSVSADTFEVLSRSLEIWRMSQGAFDVTIGPLVNLWGFGPDGRPEKVPSAKAMKQAWDRVGSDGLLLHMDDQQLVKRKDLYVDLSAIAKGYAVDRVAEALEDAGIRRYLVEVGGEIRAGNSKAQNVSWQVAVEEPVSDRRQIHKIIKLDNAAMATSGDYRNYFEANGKRYSHTIDPRNGQPIDHTLVSASVIMPSCADADAWATAFMVLGPELGMQVAEANNLAVYMILKQDQGFRTTYSRAFERYLQVTP